MEGFLAVTALLLADGLRRRRDRRTRLFSWVLSRSLCVALMAVWLGSIPAAGETRPLAAGQIAIDTSQSLRIRGSDAIAGVADWYLSNGTLCAAILGLEHHGQLIPGGGTLVDLGHCGRGDDQFLGLEPLFNLSRKEMFRIDEIEARVDDGRAQIVTHAREPGLLLTTRYVLDLKDPDRLLVHSQIRRTSPGPRLFAVADMLLHAENALRNFVINDGGEYSGFRHVSREDSSYLEIASSIQTADGVVLVGSDDQGPPVSYLYRPISAPGSPLGKRPLPLESFTLAFSSVTIINRGTQPLWFPSRVLGALQAAQFLLMDLPVGDAFEFSRELRVSKQSDVASLSDRIYSDPLRPVGSAQITGRLNDPQARVHVFRAGKGATAHMTMARTDPAGHFSLRVPRGHYRLEIRAPAGRILNREVDWHDTTGQIDLGVIELADVATVTLPRGEAMRLVFRGLDDTRDPIFGDDLSGLTLGGTPKHNSQVTTDVHLSGSDSDPRQIRLAAGRYRVYATHGPEFSLTSATLEVASGERTTLEIAAPRRLFETPGWISSDFHVHAAPSFDSTLSQQHRLRSFAAEGGEVLVATDHDVISEYTSLIEKLGLADQLTSLSGLEVTTISPTPRNPYTSGHINLFPVPYRPERNRAGALQDEGLRLREIIALAHSLPTNPLVQLNHPRRPDKHLHHGAFLDHLSVMGAPFDPDRRLNAPANRSIVEKDPESGLRDLDFDAVELLNGKRFEAYRVIQRDWFSFLSQGYRVVGLANSDTHKLGVVAAVPRNYIRLTRDDVSQFDQAMFLSATRQGHAFATTGPLLEVFLGDAGPGDQLSGNRASLSVSIRAAPWIPVSTLRVYLNGSVDRELSINGSFAESFEMEFDRDSYVVVEVEGPAEGDYAKVLPGFIPLAYSNPIFVDANEDGDWSPPGLGAH